MQPFDLADLIRMNQLVRGRIDSHSDTDILPCLRLIVSGVVSGS